MSVDSIAGLIEAVGGIAGDLKREDLAKRLAGVAARLRIPHQQVLVMGDYKQGKSSLVNALLAADVCPVDDDLATAAPIVVGYAEQVKAAVARGETDDHGRPRLSPVPLSAARSAACEQVGGVHWVQIDIPRSLLQLGMTVIDTPGTGGVTSPAAELALSVADRSSVLIAVSDAMQELTGSELRMLRLAAARCPDVILALSKTDLSRHWQRIAETNRGHLDRAGLDKVRIVPTSAVLRMLALRREDRELNEHSGYPQLILELRRALSSRTPGDRALDEAEDALEQLEAACQAARAVLRAPKEADGVTADLTEAKHRADRLRRGGARWQQVLSDGTSSLTSDAEYDLRARLRALRQEIESAIDQSEPLESWEMHLEHLGRRAVEEMLAHQQLVQQRAALVARAVASQFTEFGPIMEVSVKSSAFGGQGTTPIRTPEVELARSGVGTKALSALRAGTGSVTMFGVLGSLVGLQLMNPLLAPVTIVAGIGFGAKALRDESTRELTARRATAKSATRQAIEELTMAEAKMSRDTIRAVHRELREGFTARAVELQAALDAAVRAADEAGRTERTNRDAEAKRLQSVWEALSRLRGDLRKAHAAETQSSDSASTPSDVTSPRGKAQPAQVSR